MPTGSFSPSIGFSPPSPGISARFSMKKLAYLKNRSALRFRMIETMRYARAFFGALSRYLPTKKPKI